MMKILVILIMLAALYLLYRIAFPKERETKKGGDILQKKQIDTSEVVVKSRFVRPDFRQLQPARTASLKTDYQEEKPDIFVSETKKREVTIPVEKLDKIFNEEPNPEDLDIEPDENETDVEVDVEEEAEELRQVLGQDLQQADGWSIEEMTMVVEATQNPTDEKAALLYRAEKTDMFEQLVSGDEGKAGRIAAIIERHIQRLVPEDESNAKNDLEHFDVMEFLS
jgi:hypothetical protein